MNLLCPNCQKMLQVPEQYAGQQMKCPLCAGSFTVPALPPMPAAVSSPPPMSSPTPPGPGTAAALSSAPPREVARGGDHSPDDGAGNRLSSPKTEAAPPPEGYTHSRSYTLHRRIIPFVAPVLLVLVFVLTFFPWVGLYPGGESAGSQSVWGAAFGSFDPDPVWVKAHKALHPTFTALDPGAGGLMIIWIFLFLLLVLPVAVASVVISQGTIKLPPALLPIVPWRAAILTGLVLVAFLLLLLQLFAGFRLESAAQDVAEKQMLTKRSDQTTPEEKQIWDYQFGERYSAFGIRTTFWLRLVELFLVLALVAAALEFWLERRGNKPLPRADLMW